jgi:AcrR family transcriptional regulator
MNKKTEITIQTKQNISDAFWTLYCEKRIEKITVKEITDKAGYNRGTFYEYFSDVYDVLDEIESKLIPSLNELPPVSTPSGSVGMPIEAFLTLWEQNAKYYSVLLGDKGDPAFASKLKNSIKPTVMKALKDKPDIDKEDMEYILEYTLSAMIGVMSYWFRKEGTSSRDHLFKLIHELMVDGIMKHLPL